MVAFFEGAAAAQTADRGLREVLMGVHDAAHGAGPRPAQRAARPAGRPGEGAGELRQDADATDIGIVLMMLCTVADLAGDIAPELWRRYLPMLLDGLRRGARRCRSPPVAETVLRKGMATHKQRLMRASPQRPPAG